MKRWYKSGIIAGMILVALMLTGIVLASTSIPLSNPGFEDGSCSVFPVAWTCGGTNCGLTNCSYHHSGSKSWMTGIYVPSASNGAACQPFTITTPSNITVTAWFRAQYSYQDYLPAKLWVLHNGDTVASYSNSCECADWVQHALPVGLSTPGVYTVCVGQQLGRIDDVAIEASAYVPPPPPAPSCIDTELIASPVTLSPVTGQWIQTSGLPAYQQARVIYTLYSPDYGVNQAGSVRVNYESHTFGPFSFGDDQMYSLTVPYVGTTDLSAETSYLKVLNTGSNESTLLSACVISDTHGYCANPDADLLDYSAWTRSDSTLSNGVATLEPGGYIQRDDVAIYEAGTYRVTAVVYATAPSAFNLYLNSQNSGSLFYNHSAYWTEITHDFVITSADWISLKIKLADANTVSAQVDVLCIYRIGGATPTQPSPPACSGIEAVDSSKYIGLWMLSSGGITVPLEYQNAYVRYTFWDFDATTQHFGQVQFNDQQVTFGPTSFVGGLYTVTVPSVGTIAPTHQPTLWAVQSNSNSTRPFRLLSACIISRTAECRNDDQDITLSSEWMRNKATISGTVATLLPGGFIAQLVNLDPGFYRVTAIVLAGQPSNFHLYVDAMSSTISYQANNVWQEFSADFEVATAGSHMLKVQADGANPGSMAVDYLCIYLFQAPTPPGPTTWHSCVNPDAVFDDIDQWNIYRAAVIDNVAIIQPGGYITSTIVVTQADTYSVTASTRSSTAFQQYDLIFGFNRETKTTANFWREQAMIGQAYTAPLTLTIGLQTNASNVADVSVSLFCMEPISATPPTTPTIPIAPYPPGICYNDDPGLDTSDYWHPAWGASIADGIATLPAGSTLMVLDVGMGRGTYQVEFRARAASDSQMAVSWGLEHEFIIIDASSWVTYSFEFDVTANATNNLYVTISSQNQSAIELDWLCLSYLRGSPIPPGPGPGPAPWPGPGPTPWPDEWPGPQFYHPVCMRDWISPTVMASLAMEVGPDSGGGMPVHAMAAGTAIGRAVSSVDFNGYALYDCYIFSSHVFSETSEEHTYLCNLDAESIVFTGDFVERGALLGYTLDSFSGKLFFGITMNDVYVDPTPHMEGYPNCHIWRFQIEPLPACDGDDGNGTFIIPRFNESFPGIDISQYIPWLATKLYDTVAYPILCGVVSIMNAIIAALNIILDALIAAIDPITAFLYQIQMTLDYAMNQLLIAVIEMVDILYNLFTLINCIISIVNYFVQAFTSASSADAQITTLDSSNSVAVSMSVVFTLLSSTVANTILIPMVGLLFAVIAWKLVPWSIRTLRSSIQEGSN